MIKRLIIISILIIILSPLLFFCYSISGEWKLRSSISSDSVFEFEHFLNKGINPNTMIQDFGNRKSRRSLLHYAIENGSLEVTGSLLANGADPNIKSYGGLTPLMYLLCMDDDSSNYSKLMDLLLPITNLDMHDNNGRNALHYAAIYGNDRDYNLIFSMKPILAQEHDSSGESPLGALERRQKMNPHANQ